MHPFDVLRDPIRRRILEVLSDGEHSAGQVADLIMTEFGVSQPTVSRHLHVLKENGFATDRHEGTKRIYAVDPTPLRDIDRWFAGFRNLWRTE